MGFGGYSKIRGVGEGGRGNMEEAKLPIEPWLRDLGSVTRSTYPTYLEGMGAEIRWRLYFSAASAL